MLVYEKEDTLLPVWNNYWLVVPWFVLLILAHAIYIEPINHVPHVRYPIKVRMDIPTCYPVVGMNPQYCTTLNPLYSHPRKL